MRARGRWASVRAGLIAVVIGFGLVDGCPVPAAGHEAAWQRWYVEPLREVQQVVAWPVSWVRPTLRIAQQWALYQAPGGERYRLVIDGEDRAGAWTLLFRAGDPEHAEEAEVLTAARVLGASDVGNDLPAQYAGFARWISDRLLAHHPELSAVRVQLEKITIIPGGFVASGQFAWPTVRTRGDR